LLLEFNCNSLCSWIDFTFLLFSLKDFELLLSLLFGFLMVGRDMHRKASIHEMGVRIIGGFLQFARICQPYS
jgi:hypothetical protein